MANIDFGTLITAVVREMDYVESELSGHERHDTRAALQHYQREVTKAIRAAFDEAEQEQRIAESAEDRRCPRCGEGHKEQDNFCGMCRMPLSKEGERAVVREVIEARGSSGGLSAEEIDQFVGQLERCDPDVFGAALKAYVDATASLCKAASV